jgi:hypothetical protein
MGRRNRMATSSPSTSQGSSSSSIDMVTLAITAIASAAAAFICSQIWARGTLASAAVMPVLVALMKEALSRPAKAVSQAVPVRGVVRSASRADEPLSPEPIAERVAQQGEIHGPSGTPRRRGWRTAIITGLLGFLVGAVIITVPELVAGQAASGGQHETTLFGGQQNAGDSATPTDTTTTTVPTDTITVPPAETVTVPPSSTIPTTTVPPEQPQTVPETPVPTTTEPVPPTTSPAPTEPVLPP